MSELDDRILRGAAVIAKSDFARDMADKCTCDEADAIAGMLAALGEHAGAREWAVSHANDDKPGDRHYQEF